MCTLKQATLASCVVAWHIARAKKPHSIGEKLIKPAAIDMVRIMCGDDVAKKLDVSEKLLVFKEKLKLWKRKIKSPKTASFPVFNQFLEDMEEVCLDDVQIVIKRRFSFIDTRI